MMSPRLISRIGGKYTECACCQPHLLEGEPVEVCVVILPEQQPNTLITIHTKDCDRPVFPIRGEPPLDSPIDEPKE